MTLKFEVLDWGTKKRSILIKPESKEDKAACYELALDCANNPSDGQANITEEGLSVMINRKLSSGCVYDGLWGITGEAPTQ